MLLDSEDDRYSYRLETSAASMALDPRVTVRSQKAVLWSVPDRQ